MKVRSALLLLPVTAALSLGSLTPAQAVGGTSVTGLTLTTVTQAPGGTIAYKVGASWDALAGASGYTVRVLDENCDTNNQYDLADVTAPKTSYAATLANLGETTRYCLTVTPKGVANPEAATATFDTPEADVTAPNGVYTIDRRSGYLTVDFNSEDFNSMFSAIFVITQKQAESDIASRKVDPGDGTGAKDWAKGQTFDLRYTKAGTFTPKVLIADKFDNVRTITMPTVRVLEDNSGPRIKINKPSAPTRAKSWQVVRGTVSDTGSGVAQVFVFVMEKRGAIWWTYDARKHKWLKGTSSRKKTEKKSQARPLLAVTGSSGRWHTRGKVKGLRPGTLYIQAAAFDQVFNLSFAKPVTARVH